MKPNYITVTNIIIGLCVISYYLSISSIGRYLPRFELYYIENSQFHGVQFLSHMFMHGGITHLLFNMVGLWMFGSALESIWKKQRFLIYYLLCGFGAAALYMTIHYFQFTQYISELINAGLYKNDILETFESGKYYSQFPESEKAALIYTIPMVGASGALYGLLVGFAWYFPNHKIMLIFLPVPVAAKFFVPALLALDMLSGITGFSIFGQNIAHFAHIGGAITAVVLLLTVFQRKQSKFQPMGIWRE